jgi:hypothetical protein
MALYLGSPLAREEPDVLVPIAHDHTERLPRVGDA